MLHIMNKIAVRALWVFILITVACSVEFKAQASDYIGTVKLRMTGKMAKNNMYGPWVYSEPIDKAPTNVFVTYTIYDDKILDENGSVYQCVDKGNVVNGVSTSVYKVDETTYLLRIGKELIVILEEGDNDFYLELAGVNGPPVVTESTILERGANCPPTSQYFRTSSPNVRPTILGFRLATAC